MDRLQTKIRSMLTPRKNTDLQGEILNIIAAPIYVYTITTVFYYSLFYVMPYHYGNDLLDRKSGEDVDFEDSNWMLFLNRLLLSMIYFEMMSNWLGIKYVDNSLTSSVARRDVIPGRQDRYKTPELTSVFVNPENKLQNTRGTSLQNGRDATMSSIIPGPTSAPTPAAKKSYWSWKRCQTCDLNAPPRCHHCPMCGICVLKRDHHCFFTAKCIGFYNQRHFIVFLVWASFGTTYSTLHFIPYYFRVIVPEMTSAWEIFPPFVLVRCVFGYSSFQLLNTLFAFLFNALFIILSTGFLVDQLSYVNTGLTQFETKSLNRRKLNIVDPRPLPEKIRAVMGLNYGLSFICPLWHLISAPDDNPFEWPELKVYRGQL